MKLNLILTFPLRVFGVEFSLRNKSIIIGCLLSIFQGGILLFSLGFFIFFLVLLKRARSLCIILFIFQKSIIYAIERRHFEFVSG